MPRQRQDRVGSRLDAAADHAGEVDAEEREARIGDRVNQVADEAGALRRQFVVLAAERDDAHVRAHAAHAGDAVGLKTSTIDQCPRADRLPRRLQHHGRAVATDAAHRIARPHVAPFLAHDRGVGLRDLGVVDDSRIGHVQRGDAADVRLVLAKFVGREPPDPGQSVRPSAPLQLF